MQSVISKSLIITAGMAIFAMQFGAGNIVFALAIGHFAQDKTIFGTLGLILSAVLVPLLGLIAMTLFNGDYRGFFNRLGKIPGFILTLLMLSMLGPFGAIPRCLALSYSTSQPYLPAISLPVFSILCCVFIFLLAFRRTRILDVVGYFLTPLKLGLLIFLIVCGIIYASSLPVCSETASTVFCKGFTDGYQTMDLLGAFFICSIVLDCLRKNLVDKDPNTYKPLVKATLKASCISSVLLALIYLGFSFTAAFHSEGLNGINPEDLVSKVSLLVLGKYGGLFVCFAVTIACLTTAIALSTVFAEFIHKDISKKKINYPLALIITLVITFVISTLNFTGIVKMLTPLLALCYPSLIVLSVLNILYKIRQFKPVKVPVLITFILSLLTLL